MSLDVSLTVLAPCEVFTGNITHNLVPMANHVGLYMALWHPQEIGVVQAQQLAPILEEGLAKLKADPDGCREHTPANGWGSYEGLLTLVERYLKACKENPLADVSARG